MQQSEKLNARMSRGTKQIFVWTLAWVVSNAFVVFGSKMLWNFDTELTLAAIFLNLILGIKMLLTFKQHLADMDEMQRKIHFNAMAISLGATMVLGSIMGMLKPTGLLEQSPSPSNVLFIMGISYMVAVLVNFRRYL